MTVSEKIKYVETFNAKHRLLNTKAELYYDLHTRRIIQTGFMIKEQKSNSIAIIDIEKSAEAAHIQLNCYCKSIIIQYNGDCLEELTINIDGVRDIKVEASNNKALLMLKFDGCNSAVSINLSGIDTSHLTTTSEMFQACLNLKEIEFGNLNTSRVRDMEAMFQACSSLEKLDLSFFDTSNAFYMPQMFSGCSKLRELNLSTFKTDNVRNMYGMFFKCESIRELNLDSFCIKNLGIADHIFGFCTSLRKIEISNEGLKKLKTFKTAFVGCKNLEYIGDKHE